jgi:hypothetical protein
VGDDLLKTETGNVDRYFLKQLIGYIKITIERDTNDINDPHIDDFTERTQFIVMHALAKIVGEFHENQLKKLPKEEKREYCREIRNDVVEALQEITTKDDNRFKKLYANYLLWSNGFKPKNKTYDFLFGSISLLVLSALTYSDYRLILSLFQIPIELIIFEIEKYQCNLQRKVYTYMQPSGKHECTVCGDLPDVYYKDAFHAQTCIDGLLRKHQPATMIIKALKRVLPFGIGHIDLSKQNWQQWSEDEMRSIFDLIRRASNGMLDYFDLSSQILEPEILSANKTAIIADTFAKMNVTAVDFTNNYFSVNDTAHIIENFGDRTEVVNLSNMRLGSTNDTEKLSIALSQVSNLNHFIARGNLFDNRDMFILSPILHQLNLAELDLGGNRFDEVGIAALSGQKFLHLVKIDLSNLKFKATNLTAIKPLIRNPNLKNFTMRNSGINENNLLTFVDALKQSKLTYLDFTSNQLGHGSGLTLGAALQNSTVVTLILAENPLGDLGVANFAKFLPYTQLEEINLSKVGLCDEGIKVFSQHLPNTTIIRIDFSFNQISTVGVYYLAPALKYTNMTGIILNNNIIGDSGLHALVAPIQSLHKTLRHLGLANTGINHIAELFKVLRKVNLLETLGLQGNNILTHDYDAAMRELGSVNITRINLSDTQATSQVGQTVAKQLPLSTITHFDFSNNRALGDKTMAEIAQHLVTPHPNVNQLMVGGSDEMRLVHNAKPATKLTELYLNNVGISAKGGKPICWVLPSTKIPIQHFSMGNNFIRPDQINLMSCHTSSASRIKLPAIFSLPGQILNAILRLSEKFQLMFFQAQIIDMQSSSALVPIIPLQQPKIAMECIIQGDTIQCRGIAANAQGGFDYFYLMADIIPDQMQVNTLLWQCAAAFVFAFRNDMAKLAKPYLPGTFVSLCEHYNQRRESVLINAGIGMIVRGKCNSAAGLVHDVTYVTKEIINKKDKKAESWVSKATKTLLTFGGSYAAASLIGVVTGNLLIGYTLLPVLVKTPDIWDSVSKVYNKHGFFAAVDKTFDEVSLSVPGGGYVRKALACHPVT